MQCVYKNLASTINKKKNQVSVSRSHMNNAWLLWCYENNTFLLNTPLVHSILIVAVDNEFHKVACSKRIFAR